jgi:MYXO-CTERM domain-containing protein
LSILVVLLSISCERGGTSAPHGVPEPVAAMVARARVRPFLAEGDHFVASPGAAPGTFRPLSRPLAVAAPAGAREPVELSFGTARIAVRRRAMPAAQGELVDGAIFYGDDRRKVRSITFADGDALEEIFVVAEPTPGLGYDLALPTGMSVRATRDPGVVEIVDAQGEPSVRVSALRAWDADGAPVAVSLAVDAHGIGVALRGEPRYPVAIDPSWVDAALPLKLRTFHTATLLADGRVLVVGGVSNGVIDGTSELYDPKSARSVVGPALKAARGHHAATLLQDGRVLVVGGQGAGGPLDTTEIFDPKLGDFVGGPTMSHARSSPTATLLHDGRVLVVGSDGAEVFDPTTNTFSTPGQPTASLSGVVAARLADGRVLVVGTSSGTVANLFDPTANGGVGAFTATGAPSTFDPGNGTLTLLRDGRALIVGGCPCFSVGGPTGSSNHAELFDPSAGGGVGAFVPTGNATSARLGHTATLLPNGQVLLAGELDVADTPEAHTGELFDPATGTFTSIATPMNARRGGHTATLLPSGDVLLLGGDQAAAEVYVGGGQTGSTIPVASPNLVSGRGWHTATSLVDGRVLLAGGLIFFNQGDAEVYDPTTASFTATGAMVHLRRDHTATLLRDGEVLVAGGYDGSARLPDAELYDPTTNAFTATAPLSTARMNAAAVSLPDGRVLVVGGLGASGKLDSAEIYDPATGKFTTSASTLPTPMSRPAAALLPNGRVLVVGPSTAALYDPLTDAFTATGSPGAVRPDDNTLLGIDDDVTQIVVLASGRALVLGGGTLAGELYDVATGTFSFTNSGSAPRINHTMSLAPTGQAVVIGGNPIAIEPFATGQADALEPAGPGGGLFYPVTTGVPRSGHTSTVLPNGDLLVAGGFGCFQICAPVPLVSTERYHSVVTGAAWAPVITQAPATVKGGDAVMLTGLRFRGPEASGGGPNASATSVPIAVWQPLAHPTLLVGTLEPWSDTSATWHVPATAYAGPGRLYVFTDGVPSAPALVTIEPAPAAVPCAFGSECGTGFCADGVCCDKPCDGACDGCTAARKGSGADGVCGAVPPELDPNDACVVSKGGPCDAPGQCATGFCVDGLCCDSACAGTCEACDVSGSLGTCVPVKGLPHAKRPACEPTLPADLCQAKICDGVDRATCAAVVGPCTPFACDTTACFHACETNEQCAPGYHCDAGDCVAGQCDGSHATTQDGQVVDCAPYNCRPDGSCRTSCATVDDCAAPAACDFQGRCVPRPAPDNTASCGCRVADDGETGSRGLALFVAAAAVAFARRRRVAVALVSLGSAMVLARSTTAGPAPSGAAETPPASPSPPPPAPAASTPTPPDESKKAEALERFERGVAFTREQRWSAALAEFIESRKLYPTRAAAQNIAFCLASMKRPDEALDAYEALLREYPNMDEAKQKEALKAIADLKPQVGSVDVDGAEPGATILVDGIQRATFPAAAPVRVASGSHVVRIDAKLVALRESGTLKVVEKQKRALAVLVDNVEVGKTPFEGALAVGKHVVVLRGEGKLGSVPTAAPVEVGRTTSLELAAVELDAELRVEPKPAGAAVTIDAVSVGLGTWQGALPAGPHRIEVLADGFHPERRDVKLAAAEPTVVTVVLQRDEDDARWKIPAKIAIEASGSFALFPRYFGNTTEGCGSGCSVTPGLGAIAVAHFTYELGSGVGFGISGGYLFTTQAVHGRTAPVRPVGLPARNGSVSDTVSASGGMAAAHVSYHFGDRAPVLLRLAVGPWFGKVRDERVGSFTLDDGFTYQAGPAVQDPFTVLLAITPEVRFFYRVTKKLEVSLGLSTPVLVALKRPRWDPKKEVDAAIDGIGAFDGENLTGPAWFLVAPGLGARYAF